MVCQWISRFDEVFAKTSWVCIYEAFPTTSWKHNLAFELASYSICVVVLLTHIYNTVLESSLRCGKLVPAETKQTGTGVTGKMCKVSACLVTLPASCSVVTPLDGSTNCSTISSNLSYGTILRNKRI
ncbi:hypothetical protein L915_00933 [Phytophthora nicotianae]|uniref:Uncharacterized protein n=1 Tax=Phytophthora nicotianae TaxID=4792 RepID=W2P6T3_PHYNI|nr:hypothetical protein L915_00933 [Phytophthora nicotianae]ETL49617.1 hypothetical protein L916_00921 [Phytophthora nicotianae]ETM55938.1 hypothetical protein L914_00927 [Phytophthora nicotianae]